jgi:hypothetical protein
MVRMTILSRSRASVPTESLRGCFKTLTTRFESEMSRRNKVRAFHQRHAIEIRMGSC